MDNLFSIAERFGTPCFVFDEVQLEARMRAVREIVPKPSACATPSRPIRF